MPAAPPNPQGVHSAASTHSRHSPAHWATVLLAGKSFFMESPWTCSRSSRNISILAPTRAVRPSRAKVPGRIQTGLGATVCNVSGAFTPLAAPTRAGRLGQELCCLATGWSAAPCSECGCWPLRLCWLLWAVKAMGGGRLQLPHKPFACRAAGGAAPGGEWVHCWWAHPLLAAPWLQLG